MKVSAAQARQQFHGCTPEYIRDVCKASCCRSSTAPQGIIVTIHRSEQAAIEAAGGTVTNGLLDARGKRCPFQNRGTELCDLHFTDHKPFGCIASPFTLSKAGTLIVRNRYRMLRCFKDDRDGPTKPAYVAFRASLDRILGEATAAWLCAHLDAGGGDVEVPMSVASHRMLIDNDATKKASL